MKNKLVFVSGIAVGYVLGIQAGKDSFEKLKVKVRSFREGRTRRDKLSDTAKNTPEVQEQASPAGKKTKEEITGAPPHDTTPHKEGETAVTAKHDRPKSYAPPESDFYGIGGPASHESLDADTAQQANRDETGGHNRTD